ncbi:MAG: hypothetical protein GY821_04175 [Gammaproteobacteria bacterium]|nr:hypothetical protein [Gammaproteobacteria bacterium]
MKCRFICPETQRIVIKTVSRRDLTPNSEELSDDDFNDMKEIVKGGGQIGRKYIYPYVQKQAHHYGIDDNSPSVQFSKMALPRESQVQIYVTGGVGDGDGGDQQLKCRFTNYKQDFATDGGMTDDQTNSRVGNKNKIIEKTISKDDLQISQKEFNKLLSDLKNNKPISAEMRSCIETHLTELSNGPEINCERNVSFASLFLALFTSTAAISFFKTKGALLDSLGNGFGRVGLLALIVMSPDTVIKALTQVLKTSQAIEDNRKILEELESIFKILSSRNPFTILKFFLTGLDTTGDFIIVMLTMPPILIAALGVGIPCRLFLAFAIAVKNAIWSLAMSAVFTGKKVCAALIEDSDEEMIQSLPKLYRQQCPCVFYNPATGDVYYYGKRKKTVWRRITDFFKLREKTDVRKRELRLKTKRAIQNHLKENQGELKGVENIKKVSDMRICIYITSNDNDFLDDKDFAERGDFRKADGNLDNIIYSAITNEENNRVSIGFSYIGLWTDNTTPLPVTTI